MKYAVHRVKLKDEFRVCPHCGYEDGFHTMLKRDKQQIQTLYICPACHDVFEIEFED